MYYIDMQFYSPEGRHGIDLTNLIRAATRSGIELEVLHQKTFRNWQRYGARTMQTVFRLRAHSVSALERFVRSIRAE